MPRQKKASPDPRKEKRFAGVRDGTTATVCRLNRGVVVRALTLDAGRYMALSRARPLRYRAAVVAGRNGYWGAVATNRPP